MSPHFGEPWQIAAGYPSGRLQIMTSARVIRFVTEAATVESDQRAGTVLGTRAWGVLQNRRIQRENGAAWNQQPSGVLLGEPWKSKSANFLGKWLAILDGFRNWARKTA
jgi:hypothetical protein